MRFTAKSVFLLAILSALCAACIVFPVTKRKNVAGSEISKKDARFIEAMITTRRDVIKKLGPPSEWLENRRVLIYEWTTKRKWCVISMAPTDGVIGVTVKTRWLFVQFDEQDLVEVFTFKKNVDPSKRDRILEKWLEKREKKSARHETISPPP
jgi:hypothetical protein